MLYCCITPERERKTDMMMSALAAGWHGHVRKVLGEPPDDGFPFAVWGQAWLAMRIVPRAVERRRPFWHMDNGYWRPARGTPVGFYRICYSGMAPLLLSYPDMERGKAHGWPLAPWRKDGRHVLLALPGHDFGAAIGLSMPQWMLTIESRVRAWTDRPIRIRSRDSTVPPEEDFRDCWAVVTHSSNIGTDAVRAGIPVFCERWCPAAPVGNLDLSKLEEPSMPGERECENWWCSLICQQYTLDEMRDGTAYRFMMQVREQARAAGTR